MKKLLTAAMIAISSPVGAVDLTTVLKDDAGQPAQDQYAPGAEIRCGEKTGYKCLTLGSTIFHGLTVMADQADQTADPAAKYRRGKLAEKVYSSEQATFTAEETVLIKNAVGKLYGPWIVKQAWDLLDPASAK